MKKYLKRLTLCLSTATAMALSAVYADSVQNLPVPQGYERLSYPRDSYSGWIQILPVKTDNNILTHNAKKLPSRIYNRFAVVNIPLLFQEDLEQCADYCMRFWAEYHNAAGKLDSLFLFSYNGEKQYYISSGLPYRDFLRRAFGYSNSYSLKTGCAAVADALRPGDMIVQNDTGGIGHVSMIVDACENREGNRLYLIGFSFMPAQEFHIEKSPGNASGPVQYGFEGWFSIEGYINFLARYYPYGKPVIRRFK